MSFKRRTRNRKFMPDDVYYLFMLGSGANTQYTRQEIKNLWQEYGPMFLKGLPPMELRRGNFQKEPMIFFILGTSEAKERKRFL